MAAIKKPQLTNNKVQDKLALVAYDMLVAQLLK
jgi:hypothetical protein